MGKARMRIDSRVLQMAEGKKKGVLYIYDTVQNDGYDWWNGEKIVSETSEAFIRDRLAEMGAVEEIDIHISSSGGSVKVGLGIYSQIKSFGCPKKVAYIDGMAASIATVIAMAADEVVMQNAGLMMIHDAWIECTSGNAKELRKRTTWTLSQAPARRRTWNTLRARSPRNSLRHLWTLRAGSLRLSAWNTDCATG